MAADLRYRVTGPNTVACVPSGEILRAGPDPDEHGRHTVGGELVNLVAAVAGGVLAPQSKAAAEAAGLNPDDDRHEPDKADKAEGGADG